MMKRLFCIVLLTISFATAFAQSKKGLLWEISGNGMKQSAYLSGTVHLYDTSLYALPQLPAGVLDKADKVYFELDISSSP